MTTSRPASAAMGICSTRPVSSAAKTSTHTPCITAEADVRAPELTLVVLRTITPVTGNPPSIPEVMFALP